MSGKKGSDARSHGTAAKGKPCRQISNQGNRPKNLSAGQRAYLDWLAEAPVRQSHKATS